MDTLLDNFMQLNCAPINNIFRIGNAESGNIVVNLQKPY